MNKIAAYELLIEDHPLWTKEAEGAPKSKAGLLAAGLLGAGAMVPITMATERMMLSEGQRKRLKKERRDPRLYSNLRGALTFESREKRKQAHKKLSKGDGTILGAMNKGFRRK